MVSTPKQRTLKTRHRITLANKGIGVKSERPYQIWPLRNEEDYSRAIEVVDRLAVKGEKQLTPFERDQLDVFTTLIEQYEDEHHNIKPLELSPIDFLKLLMRENGMNASDLGKLLGDRALGYRVLKGERDLSKSHIKTLSDRFKVDAGSFI